MKCDTVPKFKLFHKLNTPLHTNSHTFECEVLPTMVKLSGPHYDIAGPKDDPERMISRPHQ